MVRVIPFGTLPQGGQAHLYTLNSSRARVSISDFGATIVSIETPDGSGQLGDIVLGYDSVDAYLADNSNCFGATIGPIANRTDQAQLTIGTQTYFLPKNDGNTQQNNLHSDLRCGLHKRIWDAQIDYDTNTLHLRCQLGDKELGLPGNRNFKATFTLEDEDADTSLLRIVYSCTTDLPTFVNMTNHSYFNLAGNGTGSVLDELLQIEADSFLPIREDSVSSGELCPVNGTAFDFRKFKTLGRDINAQSRQLQYAHGYDQCFCIRGYSQDAKPRLALSAKDPRSKRTLKAFVTTPGAHLYSANWLKDVHAKSGYIYEPHEGFAFEAEFYPDCVHHPEWPQPLCRPDHAYSSTIIWHFGIAK